MLWIITRDVVHTHKRGFSSTMLDFDPNPEMPEHTGGLTRAIQQALVAGKPMYLFRIYAVDAVDGDEVFHYEGLASEKGVDPLEWCEDFGCNVIRYLEADGETWTTL